MLARRPQLLAEQGCGPLTAAILIGHTAGNQRFRSEAAFAAQCGTAPVPCSSGQRTQHRLNRGGDRQLNHALHIIAVTRAKHDPATRDYLVRKEADGQTTKDALRCLKRHLARRFHHLLSQPPLTPTDDHNTTKQSRHRREHRHDNIDTTIIGAAPMPIPCGS